jgi:plasmid maintenance system antidote protein VapI
MNSREFRVEMLRHDDTNEKLAKDLNVTSITISNKIKGRTSWTYNEMVQVKNRYSLDNDRFYEIFFT